jgi:Tol biopolymer transport system component
VSQSKSRFGAVAFVLVALAAALSIALNAERAHAAFPGKNGKIAFNRATSGIYTMKQNGNRLRRLRDGFEPAWSPNGKKIVFQRQDRRGYAEIWRMNASGRRLKRLTNPKGAVFDLEPAWSPNGKKIVFTRQPETRDSEIFKMNANGSRERRLTGNKADDYEPAWSPKGGRIAYTRDGDILTMNARSGQHRRNLTRTGDRSEFNPNWSPNGRRIAFAATDYRDYDNGLYKIKANGGGEQRLTDPDGFPIRGDEPAWSGLDLIRANGHPLAIDYPALDDENPDWQPIKKRRRR